MGIRVFKENGFEDVSSLVLPIDKFRPCYELDSLLIDKEKGDKTVLMAEKYLNDEIPFLPASLYRDLYLTGNRVNYQTPYFKRRDMLMYFTLAEAYEKKGRFIEKIMDVAWAIMEESSWIIPSHLPTMSPSHGDETLPPVFDQTRAHGIDLFSASTGALLALVYYYHKDALDKLSPVICDKLCSMVKDRIMKAYMHFIYSWSGEKGNPVNNWNPWINSNVLFATAIIEDRQSDRVAVINKVLSRLDCFTFHYGDDGGCPEGPNYWQDAGAAYFDCCELIYDLTGGKVNVFSNQQIKNICEFEPKVNIADLYYVSFGDCSAKIHPDGVMIRRMGEKLNSDMLYEFSKYLSHINDYHLSSSNAYRTMRNITSERISSEKYYLPKLNYLPDLKIATIRESSYPKEGMFVSLKGGTNFYSHNHNDLGNYTIYSDGKPVVIDAGVATYSAKTFSDERYTLWYMNSSHHNTPTIAGCEQQFGINYKSCDERYDEQSGAYSMQLKDAYPKEAGVVSYVKKAELIGSSVIITEDIELADRSEVIFNILTPKEPTVLSKGKIKMCEDVILTFDGALTPKYERIDIDDPALMHSWGDSVYRIQLIGNIKKDKLIFTFSK